ncbi:MAG: hypothetical protein LBH44_06095 [Treponema sp.]|jgi:hypothetical protein|nr:hypothetical protein [Treponema sp.]
MSKKVALVLIMVIFVNMAVWADNSGISDKDAAVLIVVGIGLLPLFMILVAVAGGASAEADGPDDGIRLVSSAFNFLQHVEMGQTQNNNFYAGLRFRF